MPVKNIAIREEVYNKIVAIKRDDESFSDVLERILEKRIKLSSFAGVLANDSELAAIEADIRRVRKLTVSRI
ncbi:MAG: antitoxin VapB family protein [Thaumarchaeota archaeon]|nr:antitoxin VapB family protein [Nitrososphaerota archaeon]MBI3023136.1 antitoxin VapB family protein [Nitrososphaerota archaeon]